MNISIDGMGFVVYSPFAVKKITEGEDFLTKGLWKPEDVKKQVEACQIIPFCTGSPGDYIIDCFEDLPNEEYLSRFEYILRLGIIVRNDLVCIRDLFDFTRWDAKCPDTQKISIPSGYYVMTICTSTPASGITGDNQRIEIHFHKIDFFQQLNVMVCHCCVKHRLKIASIDLRLKFRFRSFVLQVCCLLAGVAAPDLADHVK